MALDMLAVTLYCLVFLGMLILMLMMALNPQKSTSVTYIEHVTGPQPVTEVSNPFLFDLCHTEMSSLQKIQCKIQSRVSCFIQAFWCVSISDLFAVLQKDYADLAGEMANGTLLEQFCVSRSEVISEAQCDREFSFSPEIPLEDTVLGTRPRQCYPLVVVIYMSDLGDVLDTNSVVGLVAAVHIKDTLVMLDTHIMGQYLKLSSNQLCSLSNLYVPSGESESEVMFCIVCQSELACIATLPCRHLCVCRNCFSKLDRCPVCRSFISSYFISRTM